MMKTILAATLLLFTLPLLAADDPRIAEGIALHDQGKYGEAIAKYKAVLADSPGDVLATYELAFAYQAKGDAAACREVIEPIADTPGRLQPAILVILGNCLDMTGDRKRAIDVYRKGLKLESTNTQLLYNLAVTLTIENELTEARELLKKELALRPGHGSGHYLLGKIFEAEGFRAPAILEYLRFLATEPATPRALDAAQRLVALLDAGVEKKSEGEINVTIDSESRTEEGDFKGWEMMLSLASAGRFTEENAKSSEFERVRSQIALSLRMLIESPAQGQNYTVRQNLPFFAELEKSKLLDVFAGLAIGSLKLDGGEAWAKASEAGIRQYAAWRDALPR